MIARILIYAGLIPLAISAAIALFMRWQRAPPKTIWPVAIAAGFIAGQLGVKRGAGIASVLHSFVQPREAVDWLPLVVLLALGVSLLLAFAPPSARQRMLALAIVFSLSVPIRLLAGGLAQRWSILEKIAYLALVAAAFGVLWLLLSFERDEPRPIVCPLLVAITAIGMALVLERSGVLVYAQLSGAVAAAIAGSTLAFLPGVAGWFGTASDDRLPGFSSAAGVLTFSLGSLIILGHFYSGLSAVSAVLLFLSLAATGGPLPEFVARRPTWQQIAIRATACLVPLAIAVARAAST